MKASERGYNFGSELARAHLKALRTAARGRRNANELIVKGLGGFFTHDPAIPQLGVGISANVLGGEQIKLIEVFTPIAVRKERSLVEVACLGIRAVRFVVLGEKRHELDKDPKESEWGLVKPAWAVGVADSPPFAITGPVIDEICDDGPPVFSLDVLQAEYGTDVIPILTVPECRAIVEAVRSAPVWLDGLTH